MRYRKHKDVIWKKIRANDEKCTPFEVIYNIDKLPKEGDKGVAYIKEIKFYDDKDLDNYLYRYYMCRFSEIEHNVRFHRFNDFIIYYSGIKYFAYKRKYDISYKIIGDDLDWYLFKPNKDCLYISPWGAPHRGEELTDIVRDSKGYSEECLNNMGYLGTWKCIEFLDEKKKDEI